MNLNEKCEENLFQRYDNARLAWMQKWAGTSKVFYELNWHYILEFLNDSNRTILCSYFILALKMVMKNEMMEIQIIMMIEFRSVLVWNKEIVSSFLFREIELLLNNKELEW